MLQNRDWNPNVTVPPYTKKLLGRRYVSKNPLLSGTLLGALQTISGGKRERYLDYIKMTDRHFQRYKGRRWVAHDSDESMLVIEVQR